MENTKQVLTRKERLIKECVRVEKILWDFVYETDVTMEINKRRKVEIEEEDVFSKLQKMAIEACGQESFKTLFYLARLPKMYKAYKSKKQSY